MKTSHQIISKCILLIAFVLAGMHANAQSGYFTVEGIVRDKITRGPLEYVTISVADYNIGTVSNADGRFTLKIPERVDAAFVECSYIGYLSFRIPVNGESIANVDVVLAPHSIELSDLFVTAWDAQHLVREAVNKIPVNYSASSSQLTGFYRETVQKRRNYINISEAVAELYKTPYAENVDRDLVQVLKGRRLLSQRAADTLAVKLQGGPNLSIFLDIVKNPDILLDRETLSDFSYKVEGFTQINGRDQYVVSFTPQVIRPYPLYAGRFCIDMESLAFTRAEFSMDMTDRDKVTGMILKKKPVGLRFRPEEISYTVTYQERGGVYYLSYIRNELMFSCDWRRRLFQTNYAVVSEIVVTDINLQNVTAIPWKNAFRNNQVLNDRVMDFYDENFWGAYNIIEPTESLELAVERLKKRQRD